MTENANVYRCTLIPVEKEAMTENMETLEAAIAAANRLQDAHAASTQGKWATTTYAGGFNFGGKARAYCGTDHILGEPRTMPETAEDNVFIALAHNELPAILAAFAAYREQVARLQAENARLTYERRELKAALELVAGDYHADYSPAYVASDRKRIAKHALETFQQVASEIVAQQAAALTDNR